MFCRYALRTTDVEGARRFYEKVVGLALPAGGKSEDSSLEAWPLHQRALAHGAPPHWLGLLAVDDVEATASQLVQLGAQRLGPTVRTADAHYATLRDPFGAAVAVSARQARPSDDRVAWHQLHVQDAAGAWTLYAEVFGWVHTETVDMAELVGGHRLFAWRGSSEAVGSIANSARWPGVHPHWLFYFPVADIDAAVARVRALGGTAMAPLALTGSYLSACEDPRGAAFGLMQRP